MLLIKQEEAADGDRQERVDVHQHDTDRGVDGKVAQAEIQGFEQQGERDREQDAADLPTPVELAAQQRDQRDDGEGDRGQRDDQALVTLEAETVAERRAPVILGKVRTDSLPVVRSNC